jgi:hypothetical protein
MNSDKELLEMAAKAAGIKGRSDSFGFVTMEAGYDADPLYWNPLSNDAEAFRLAVKLNLHVDANPWSTTVFAHKNTTEIDFGLDFNGKEITCMMFDVQTTDCPYASTRRAIVLAAAKLGELK